MSFETIHLRKLLKVLYLDRGAQISELRSDIRSEIARDAGAGGEGGDFHGPFWSDAKDHVFHRSDLRDTVRARIESNPARARLYPQLRDGFLLWWEERRRWTNEPFQPIDSPRARYLFQDLGATVKVENLLAVRDARGADRLIYPYFSEEPPLSEEGARIGLWLMSAALPAYRSERLRILDVMRGRSFSTDRVPLQGDEERIFRERYGRLLEQWRKLWDDYL
jgi:hypothetical protein